MIVGNLTAGVRYQARVARYREQRARQLYEMAKSLGSALTPQDIAATSQRVLDATLQARCLLLLPDEQDEYFPKFNVDGLLRGDYQSRMQGYATGISNGFLSPNDIHRLENMDLIPAEKGGDDYYLNGGYVKLQDAGKQVKADPAAEDTRRKK